MDGTPVAVSVAAATPGIDFSLERLGSVAGTVTDAVTGAPLAGVRVELRTASPYLSWATETDPAGVWELNPHPGTYAAIVDAPETYVDEIYDDLPCPGGSCDRGVGKPIEVAFGTAVGGIDFRLERGGAITGTVRDLRLGEPIHDARVRVFDGQVPVWSGSPDTRGRYRTGGLPDGDYFVLADSSEHLGEVYGGLPCPQEQCDVTAGAPVTVSGGGFIPGIDFELASLLGPVCRFSDTALCLRQGRFRLEARWRDAAGVTGAARGEPLTRDTGYFFFFEPGNVELVVKVLDACYPPFDRFWVYAGGLTDIEVTLTVTDTATGESRSYFSPLGTPYLPIRDTDAFATCAVGPPTGLGAASRSDGPSGAAVASPAGVEKISGGLADCHPNDRTLCLNRGRFEVRAFWETEAESGEGQAVELTDETGYFWFFDEKNVEAVVKVLDACELAPSYNYWVFAAGLTDVGVRLRVVDKDSGEVREWVHPPGTAFQPIVETGSFRKCP